MIMLTLASYHNFQLVPRVLKVNADPLINVSHMSQTYNVCLVKRLHYSY